MEIKNIVAVGVLAIVAGGAYYYFMYEPEQDQPAVEAPPAAVEPQPAPAPALAQAASEPAVAQPVPPASGVPTVVPEKQPPAAVQASGIHAPAPEIIAEPAKPEFAVKKVQKKKPRAKARPKKQVAQLEEAPRPDQAARLDSKPEAPGSGMQAQPQPQDLLVEPQPDASAEPPETPVEPAPAPAEPVSVVPAEPPSMPGVITPKYNDIVTAVLRRDMEAVKELLDLGWWADKPSASGVTPLMAAVMNRDAPMVQLLLEHGAAPTVQALDLARKNKDAETAALLEQKGAR